MSLKYRDVTGKETPIAGLNGLSGELVPSVSKYQSGTVTIPEITIAGHGYTRFQVTLSEAMPDTDYVVNCSRTLGTLGIAGKVGVDSAGFSKTGFYLSITNASTEEITVSGTIAWQAFKLMTDESRALGEAAIAQNASDIAALKTTVAGKADKNAGTPTIKDCNNIIACGMWGMNPNIANQPTGAGGYGVLEVYGTNTEKASATNQWIFQRLSATNGHIYVRSSINPNSLTPTNWSDWKDITGEEEDS